MANEILSSNVVHAIAQLVAADGLEPLVGNIVMGNLVNRDFEAVLAEKGDTLNIPIPPTMSATNLAEAGSVTAQNKSLGNAQIVLTKHIESTFVIPDVVKVLTTPDLLPMYMQPCINALSEEIEGDLFGLYPQATGITAVGTGNTAITEAVIDSAETALFTAKVPQNQPKYLAVSEATYGTLRQIGRFSEQLTYGNGVAISEGQVLKVKGFNVFRSQYVKKPSTTTYNLGFVKDFAALAMRRLPLTPPGLGAVQTYMEKYGYTFRVTMSYDPSILSAKFTVDCLYGTGVLRNNHGLQVLS
jgi:hypothetical protein